MKSFTVDKKIKLSKLLEEKYGAEMPYSSYKKLLRNKDIKINGKRVNADVALLVGDFIEVYFDGVKKPLNVVFKDENVLILDKPAGITSEDFSSLVKNEYEGAVLCHRLDRNTSGLLVFALNGEAEKELLKAFKEREIDKYYLTEVYGSFEEETGVLTDYLVKDSESSTVKIYSKEVQASVKIITEYKTVEKLEETSILSIKLITGKTHQIRAHLAFYGKFVIGDGKYGNNLINKRLGAKFQRLTAKKLIFNVRCGALSYLNGKTVEITRKPW